MSKYSPSNWSLIRYTLLARNIKKSHGLLNLITKKMNDKLLLQIAESDYGNDIEQHFAELKKIINCRIPAPIGWHPREVLHLSRWDEFDDSDPLATERHWKRIFVCTAILEASLFSENKLIIDYDNETVIQLIASLLYQSTEWRLAGLSLLSECAMTLELDCTQLPFYYLGILLLYAALPAPNFDYLDDLSGFLLAEAARIHEFELFLLPSDFWPLGLKESSRRISTWQKLAVELLNPLIASGPPQKTANMQAIINNLLSQEYPCQ